MKKQNKDKQLALLYKKGYYEMNKLCKEMLWSMKRQIWVDLALMGLWFIVGIYWGISIVRWLS